MLSLPGPTTGPNGAMTPSPTQEAQPNLDKIFLEDFHVAFTVSQPISRLLSHTKLSRWFTQHWMDTAGGKIDLTSFCLPTTFCKPKLTRLRLRGDHSGDDRSEWKEREREWAEFWRARGGKEKLDNRRRGVVGGMCGYFSHREPYC